MTKPPRLEEIFDSEPHRVDLVGFSYQDSLVLHELEKTLGREPLLRRAKRGTEHMGLGFNPEFIGQRQEFFRRLYGGGLTIESLFLEKGLQEIDAVYRGRQTKKAFLKMCELVYELLEKSRSEVKPFTVFSEARRILRRINSFDSDLREMLGTLRAIGELERFAIDTKKGTFAPIAEMPPERTEYRPSESRPIEMEKLLWNVRFGLKKTAISVAERMGTNFEERIKEFVRGELRVIPDRDNLRMAYESLALPIRLGVCYQKFIGSCEMYSPHDSEDEYWFEEQDADGSDLPPEISSMPELIYPEFREHYDIRSLFPPKLMAKWNVDGRAVPINFKTRRGERKFLIAGLHSGGKSFFLDNIILLSVLGQAGFCLPGEKIVLPTYNRVFYYRNPNNSSTGMGKLETEIQQIGKRAVRARRGDLIVVDEFFDSTNNEIAGSLGEIMLDRLGKSEATVIITTHKDTDYDQRARKGWTIMSPVYSIVRGRVKLGRALKRGPPDNGINKRYIEERYGELF